MKILCEGEWRGCETDAVVGGQGVLVEVAGGWQVGGGHYATSVAIEPKTCNENGEENSACDSAAAEEREPTHKDRCCCCSCCCCCQRVRGVGRMCHNRRCLDDGRRRRMKRRRRMAREGSQALEHVQRCLWLRATDGYTLMIA
jgi:hypothetical protein